jgi:chromosome segregation ATPase
MEIDRERTAASKLNKEMESLRAGADRAAERHRGELAAVQEQLGMYRQRAGELEGNLQALTANRDLAMEDLRTARTLLDEKHAQFVRADVLATELRSQLEDARRKIDELSKAPKVPRSPRKPKTD